MYEAKVIADSISAGNRLTTMQLTHPRIVHAEFMTHCMFARNASSSRAIPFEKMVLAVQQDPFFPIYWGKNRPGMQAIDELDYGDRGQAIFFWRMALNNAIDAAERLHKLGTHKQICNRLLEPFSWITVCVTGDQRAWSNYFALRIHPDAMPEIRRQAEMALEQYLQSKPRKLLPLSSAWHLPYVDDNERLMYAPNILPAISVGRCARVSYLTQEGHRDIHKDIELHDRLLQATPMHASPFEHVAFAVGSTERHGKYIGWQSYRHTIHGEVTLDYFERHPAS